MTKAETLARYVQLNREILPEQMLFVGSSLMEQFPIEAYVAEENLPFKVYNRGISGYVIQELRDAIGPCILDLKPACIFMNIGTNDLTRADMTVDMVIQQYRELIKQIMSALPDVHIVLMAYYPVNPDVAQGDMVEALRIRSNARIAQANQAVSDMAAEFGIAYIDVNDALKDGEGKLRADYTTEGMHIRPEGYRAIMPALLPWIRKMGMIMQH